jgi:ubiquitin-conjugating enzyme E2 R
MTDAAAKLLQQQFKKLMTDPVEGFAPEIPDDSNLYNWRIYLEGPKDTIYEGGVFQLNMSFPRDYPMAPPELRFISDFWHPNVFPDGKVCISILHPPGEDEMSGERPEERWLPTQSVATIMLSVVSMLNDPNFSSPANVDASVQWRKDMTGFKRKIKEIIAKANAEFDGHIKIPHPDTNEEERAKAIERIKELNKPMDLYDEFDDYAEDDFEDDFEDGDDEDFEDGDEAADDNDDDGEASD